MLDLLAAVGLVLVIEGALYAAFPSGMQRMMRIALEFPPETLRIVGLASTAAGILVVWLVRG